MMQEFCALMKDKDGAMEWVSQIREHKPRYIRDQVQMLIATAGSLNQDITAQALDYCRTYQIISAVDFKAVAESLKPETPACVEAKIIPLNPLNGHTYEKALLEPHKSDLQAYEILFN